MSSLPKNMGDPPIAAMAPSEDTRVRVLLLLNVMATVLPTSARDSVWGISPVPDLMAVLWCAAFRTSVVSSAGVRSAMDRKCRGANGEVRDVAGGVEGDVEIQRRKLGIT